VAKEFSRSVRVAAQIHRELAELLRVRLEDKSLGMVTLSDVEVTGDLSVAKAYVSFLGASEDAKASMKKLREHGPRLRQELARCLRLRVLPELRFIYDESIERGSHMDGVFASLQNGNSEKPAETEEDA
jgi:ribosome-binding factor A